MFLYTTIKDSNYHKVLATVKYFGLGGSEVYCDQKFIFLSSGSSNTTVGNTKVQNNIICFRFMFVFQS